MITTLLSNNPQGFTDVSALGIQLQKVSGHTWNTKFKPRYGPLSEFVQSRKEFHLDENHVYLKAKWEEVKAEREEKQAKKQAKKARREERLNPTPPTKEKKQTGEKKKGHSQHNHANHQHHHDDSGRGFCYNLCIFIILFWILVVALLFLYQRGIFKPYLKPHQTAFIDKNLKQIFKYGLQTSKWIATQTTIYSKLFIEKGNQLSHWIVGQLKELKLMK